jgi:TolB-like protein/class 3 adenylate cyclase
MGETRKIAAILVADIVGYSRLAAADEDRALARLRGLRSDLIDPAVAAHRGRIVRRTGDGSIIEFRSVVDATRCAIEVQNGMVERNAGLSPAKRIEFRIGIHLGDVVEEADGDLMGDGVNIAARIEGITKPGAICLSEDAYRQVKGRLDAAVTDLGSTQLKNIADPIRVYSLEIGKPFQVRTEPVAPGSERFDRPRLSLVVLPFANLGGDPEHDYFVDGVTENLTTDLSRIRDSFVIGRHTAFSYKGKVIDLKQIGRELNVRYVLEGSVQRAANRMRVNVQLIDAMAGSHLWAERFDKPLADLFEMQDEIVARLANALNAQLVEAEARRAERSPNPDSMDLYFQGRAWLNRALAPDNVARAQSFFDRALAADPDNVDALASSAGADVIGGSGGFVSDPQAAFAAAEAKLTKALSLAPDHPLAHAYLGALHMSTKRAALGIVECEHAREIDRNLTLAHGAIGLGKLYVGRAEETEAHCAEALRLSPRDTRAYLWTHFAGVAKVFLGLDDQAIVWYRRSIESNRNFPMAHFYLSAALAQLGRLDEARSAVKAGLALHPKFAVSLIRAIGAAASDDPTYLAGFERPLEGLRKAGVPEQ